jgi:hypothetical protein
MRYLGILIYYQRLIIVEWKLVEERLQKPLSSWKGKLLSLRGRLILISSVLTNMVLHMISFFLLQKGVLHKMDYFIGLDSFGKGIVRKRNIDWLNGMLFVVPKARAGLVFMTSRSRTRPY